MKKILGLDLGVTSIGWALIEENNKERRILGLGSRIIPLSTDDKDEFSSGNAISKNQNRTAKRTQRKGYDRYQLRRANLKEALLKFGMMPDERLRNLPVLELWGLRSAATERMLTLPELGRVLLHLNQKRGYKSMRSDANLDKKDTEYVAEVKNRYQILKESGKTIGQHFLALLQKDQHYRVKQQVYPREAYIEEFEIICQEQQKYHPAILTDEFITKLRNEIIYYQRKLKSQKGLVSICEFEGFWVTKKQSDKETKLFVGPKVVHRSNPLFQAGKIWETINNITLKNKLNETYLVPLDKKQILFEYLDNNERLTEQELFKILDLKKSDGWIGNKQTGKGIQGNLTKVALLKCLDKDSPHLQFQLKIDVVDKEVFLVDRKTGEVIGANTKKVVAASVETEPLYRLWHTIYSISDHLECTKALIKNFSIDQEVAERLANIDFAKSSYSNKSLKAIRKTLPYLIEGFMYSDAASFAGYNHSDSLLKEELLKKELLKIIPNLRKNSLRQPIVEKILNQLINLVNSIIDEKQGWVTREDRETDRFEIRIELARELKQSKDERNETFASLTKRERENDVIRKRIENEYRQFNVRSTRNTVVKWRLFHEISNEESKLNAVCVYCGQLFGLTDALLGSNVDVEHIIPKSLLFDDSQSNKTLSHRKCNEDKKDLTAFDFMKTKGEQVHSAYIERIDSLYKKKIIGKRKRDKLLMSVDKIPKDFIDRQLRETQYIAKKAKEILNQICFNVWSTSGNVTAYLRDKWGWNDVTMNLQLEKYRSLKLTETKHWETNNGQIHEKEVIKGWSKRDDHRHHAIDALTIACTQQGFIQRLNTLSATNTRSDMYAEIERQSSQFKDKLSLLDKYVIIHKPFSTKQIEAQVDNVLISFKAGKKVATMSKYKATGKNSESGVLVPRGPLSEESVYGKIKTIEKNLPIKYLFENPKLIFKPYIKILVEERLAKHANNVKLAIASIKKDPIYLNSSKTEILEYGSCYKEQVVYKYPIIGIKAKDLQFIIDDQVKEIIRLRLEEFNNNEKEAFKDLDKNPVWFNQEKGIAIKAVRMSTGLTMVEPVKKDENGKDIGFVKSGNNHHIGIYVDEDGKKQIHVCNFWHAVERKKFKLPVIIKNPKEVWDLIFANRDDYEQAFLKKLPNDKWQYAESLQQNEMFVLGLTRSDVENQISVKNYPLLSKYLYRVQKMSVKGNGQIDLWFRHHLETQLNDSLEARQSLRFYNLQSLGALEKLNPVKVRINNLGKIELQ